MISKESATRIEGLFPALRGLPEALHAALFAQGALHTVPAGTALFSPGDPCTGFPLVIDGVVRVGKTTPHGREILLYRVESGESCILSSGCLLGHNQYSANGVAETEVTLFHIPAHLFQELLLAVPAFREFVFGMLGARLAEVMELVEEVAFHRVDERLARLLIHRGPVLNASHQAIADELGSAREVVSRLLGSFEHRGWVQLGRERVTVTDPKALAALAAG
jgi:CRP/FNR family transcriptional regulator